MNAFVLLGQPHGSNDPAKLKQIGGVVTSESEARELHMPYRLKRADPDFQAVHLGRIEIERTERLGPEPKAVDNDGKTSPKKGK